MIHAGCVKKKKKNQTIYEELGLRSNKKKKLYSLI